MISLDPLIIVAHSPRLPRLAKYLWIAVKLFVGSMEALSKTSLFFLLLPDWLKLNHLKSRMECAVSDMFRKPQLKLLR